MILRSLLPAITLLCVLSACRNEASQRAATNTPTPETKVSDHTVLPRAVDGVSLGMNQAEIEKKLGELRCRERGGELRVCNSERERIESVRNLEVYIHHNQTISLAYDIDSPGDAWSFLDSQIALYGKPSLSNQRSRDEGGRDHEIFGWKDDKSLYSVRFVWGYDATGERHLVGTAISIWDRSAYQKWESEAELEAKRPPADPS